MFIFLHAQENEPKEGARAPLHSPFKPRDEASIMLSGKASSEARRAAIVRL
jgi:hypothetical protein